MLDQDRLNQMWWAGYCDAALRQLRDSPSGPVGSMDRIAWMRKHVEECEGCFRANKLKGLEESAARSIGRLQDFIDGTDLRGAPGWDDAVSTTIRAAMARGELTIEDLLWMAAIAKRYGHPWQESKDT